MSFSPHTDAPEWFQRAVLNQPSDHWVEVDGCPIHYLRWGPASDQPGLLLVHGNGAHAHWWDFIAPFFAASHQVVAMDLSGMGDSGHRSTYEADQYADELMAVIGHAGLDTRTVVVGHSMGGFIALRTGARYGHRLGGVILADSPIRPPDYEWKSSSPIRKKKTYPNKEAALARFRLLPPQPCANQYIVDHIALHSVVEVEGGWSWKFDDGFRSPFHEGPRCEDFKHLSCRCGVLNAEYSSVVTPEVERYMFQSLDERVPFVTIPECHHHLFLDQPLAFVAAVRTMLAEWTHSQPHRQLYASGTET